MSQWRYIEQFLAMRCAADIIGVAHPVNKFGKEISEAMAIIRRIKPKLLKYPMDYNVVDLCSGNALVPMISAFMLPSKWNYAFDKVPRNRPWNQVKRFTYLHSNIHDEDIINFIDSLEGPVVITSVHPCQSLAERTAEVFNHSKAEMLVMMPCCVGKIPQRLSEKLKGRIGRDNLWGLHLQNLAGGRLIQDDDVISPKNRILIADKNEELCESDEEKIIIPTEHVPS